MPRKKSPSVSIILLNYNGAVDTIECLKSISNISYRNYNVVVVDNASSDSSTKIISDYFTQNRPDEFIFYSSPKNAIQSNISQYKYILIQSQINGGYGAGNNIGIKYALGNTANDYVLVINNDTIVEPEFLEPMVQMCEEDKAIGIVSGKIYFHDNPDVFWFNGGKLHPCTSKIEHNNYGEKDIGQKTSTMNTFITGCLWLLPRNTIQQVGLINEDYFMYVEDVEYCHRVTSKGYKLSVCNKSIVWHKVGGSVGGAVSTFSTYWMAKNKVRFIMQYSRSYCQIISIFYLVFFDSLRSLRTKKMALFISHIKGVIDGFR